MNHAIATFLFKIPKDRQDAVQQALDGLAGWHPHCSPCHTQYPAAPSHPETIDDFVHFMSMVVLPGTHETGDPWSFLLVEVSADGSEDQLPARLAAAMQAEWQQVLTALTGQALPQSAVAGYLRDHSASMGTSLMRRPGLAFVGTPGMTVSRIRDEARLAAAVREFFRDPCLPRGPALGKLSWVRDKVFNDPTLKWALVSEPVPLLDMKETTTGLGRTVRLAISAVRDYLWALLPLPLLWFAADFFFNDRDYLESLGRALLVLGGQLLLVAAGAAYGYARLRQEEDADDPFDYEPSSKIMKKLMERENYPGVVQNHLCAQSHMKPGWVRRAALRLALWTVAELTLLRSAPGFLNKIGTIHFARWYLLPGTDRLVFLSNYDGSWQSYLEDFIARLRQGLSSLWSNTRDFPKTTNLTSGGAGDGGRFKRWARLQQVPTTVWHTAYPKLTTASIRTNAAIRLGLAAATTEQAALEWLARLGQAIPEELDESRVPSLVYGGMPRLRFAHALVVCFDRRTAHEWVAAHRADVSYGAYAGQSRVLALGFTMTGLEKLNLPASAAREFPVAFQQGMGSPVRARLLGDERPRNGNKKAPWRWGMDGDKVDMICLAYATEAKDLDLYVRELRGSLANHVIAYERRMKDLPASGPTYEAFGFRDGISQPIIRGTKDWFSPKQAQHVVSPGEFVLGYRDNQGRISFTPCHEDENYGRDGTFLVVRHFEQDVDGFDRFVAAQARRLAGSGLVLKAKTGGGAELMCPVAGGGARSALEEWVAAKIIGRWRDGTPLVRWPTLPPSMLDRAKPPPLPGAPPPPASPSPLNEFLFGKEDPDGLRCPFGAHIRRANPRDSLDPGSHTQLEISNRHRILRVGRPTERAGTEREGMLFMCLNADIERQFEFLQQTWLLGPNFHGLDQESDAVLGPGGPDQSLSVPDTNGMIRLGPLARFVETVGGGYFFLPGRDCLDLLVSKSASSQSGSDSRVDLPEENVVPN